MTPLFPFEPSIAQAAQRALLLTILVVIIGCTEGESDPTGPSASIPEPAVNQVVAYGPINASSTDTLVYFSFATGGLVARAADWDLALRRYELRLNGPAVGGATARTVLGAGLDNNTGASDSQVLALTPANTLGAFDAVRDATIPTDDKFQTDRLTENRQAYLNLSGVPSANAANYWKVRLATGGFALLHATGMQFSPQFAVLSLTLEVRVQNGVTLGTPQTITVTPNGQSTSISLATYSVVATPAGCNWDVQFNPAPSQLALTFNSACSAGTYPGAVSPTFATATAANDAPQYAGYLATLVGPIPNSVVEKGAPFRYNLTGTDRLHPSFNTYFIKSGVKIYKLQVTDYYGNTGASGFPTIRYARIR